MKSSKASLIPEDGALSPAGPPPGWRREILGLLLLVALVSGLSQFAWDRILFNDEAVEMLQAKFLDGGRLQYFIPSYPRGRVDLIEGLVPTVNHFLFSCFGDTEAAVRGLYIAISLLSVGALYLAFRLGGVKWAAAGVFFCFLSSYHLFFNQFLTRNGISLLWTSLLLLGLVLLGRPFIGARPARAALVAVLLGITGALALWSYTSFRIVVPALLGASLLMAALHRDWRRAGCLLLAGGVTVGALALFLWQTDTPWQLFLNRGSYLSTVVGGKAVGVRLQLLLQTLTAPFAFYSNGPFLMEETHQMYRRAYLSILLWPFLILGAVHILRGRCEADKVSSSLLLATLASLVGFSLGGPNIKYPYALLPLLIWICMVGMGTLGRWVTRRNLAVLCSLYLVLEMSHYFLTIRKSDYLANSMGARHVAAEAIAQWKPGSMVVMKVSMGRDQVLWLTRKYPDIAYWDEIPGATPASLISVSPAKNEFVFIADFAGDEWLDQALKNGCSPAAALTRQPTLAIARWKRPIPEDANSTLR